MSPLMLGKISEHRGVKRMVYVFMSKYKISWSKVNTFHKLRLVLSVLHPSLELELTKEQYRKFREFNLLEDE